MEQSSPHVHQSLPIETYEALVGQMKQQGLYDRTYFHYGIHGALSITGMLVSLYIVTLTDNLLIQSFNALFFAFCSVQGGMIAHDLSHGSVLSSKSAGRTWAMFVWGIVGGLSESRWYNKHNEHHKHPNHLGHDPDLEIPFVFSDEQANERSAFFKKWVFPYQHWLFWIALAFVYPWNIMYSMKHLLAGISFRSLFEIFLMIVHFVILFAIPLWYLPLGTAILFLIIVFYGIGMYLGLAFAPNHKGEAMLNKHDAFYWTHQITLTRNLYPSISTFYLLGGLNFQIEHHLFPTMSRYKFWQAHILVKQFCAEHNIRYYETSWSGSMREIHQSLKQEAQAWQR